MTRNKRGKARGKGSLGFRRIVRGKKKKPQKNTHNKKKKKKSRKKKKKKTNKKTQLKTEGG